MEKDRFVTSSSYEEFVHNNRIKINRALNRVLWLCIITGPILALGIATGLYNQITYQSCFLFIILLVVLAAVHYALCIKKPDGVLTGIWALLSMDIAIVFLTLSHANISISMFFVPLLSLFFCDKVLYVHMVVINYIIMMATQWAEADFIVNLRTDKSSPMEWFAYASSGYAVETFLLGVAGYALCYAITSYFRALYDSQNNLVEKEKKIHEQLDLLNSISDIYGYLSIVNFEDNTVTNINSTGQVVESSVICEDGLTDMNRSMLPIISDSDMEDFEKFVNLNTLKERMKKRTSIYKEFNSTLIGWFRAQFIAVTSNENKFIYTIQDIDDDKQREENLVKISNTDELTRLYNRRAYEEDLRLLEENGTSDKLVLFSVDINGLKQVNDEFGHLAGDELIVGAAKCIASVFGNEGKAYRTGGDEFQILIETGTNAEEYKKRLLDKVGKWKGKHVESLAMSVGYACVKDYPGCGFDVIEKKADELMYQEKNRYYRKTGKDRRGQRIAYEIICETYAKVLKINLTDDSYQIIKMNEHEKEEDFGFSGTISEWFRKFGETGQVHQDDLEHYLRFTDCEYLKDYFDKGHDKISIFYRRKYLNEYRDMMMEMLPSPDYESSNQELYLYVKDINK